MLKHFLVALLLAVTSVVPQFTYAQNVAVKTNLLSDGFLNPNIGAEIGVAPRWTVAADFQFNGWTLSHDRRWKHWAVQPQARYWFCDRFGGHFVGVHAHGGQFNVGGLDINANFLGTDYRKLLHSRYQGWFVGGGVSYGYDWVLSQHWNLEAEIGVGYSYTRFDQFRCEGCGKKTGTDLSHNYWGITRLAISIVYLF